MLNSMQQRHLLTRFRSKSTTYLSGKSSVPFTPSRLTFRNLYFQNPSTVIRMFQGKSMVKPIRKTTQKTKFHLSFGISFCSMIRVISFSYEFFGAVILELNHCCSQICIRRNSTSIYQFNTKEFCLFGICNTSIMYPFKTPIFDFCNLTIFFLLNNSSISGGHAITVQSSVKKIFGNKENDGMKNQG